MVFADLDTFDQEKYFDCALSTLCIPAELDLDRTYAVYEDINSGAENLSPHQLRRAVLAGSAATYIDMIDRLRDDSHFRAIYGDKDERKEMDGELVLRALAFAHTEYKAPIKTFLSHELQNWQKRAEIAGYKADDLPSWLVDREKAFRRTMRIGRVMFGEGAFKKWDETKSKWTLSPPFFELQFAVLSDLLRSEQVTEPMMVENAGALRLAMQRAFTDKEHVISAKHTRRSPAAVRECKRALEDLILGAIGGTLDSVRTFSPELRRTLWETQQGLCPYCGELIDESALDFGNLVQIDHIIPHAHGGPTTPDNAQLLHAACNRQKGARVPSDEAETYP
jgi:5-methylcytosine-specific restriction endonuclease McrA